MPDNLYMIKQAQMQRAIGELRALKALYYNPYNLSGDENYKAIKKLIEDFITELTDNFG